MCKKAENSKAGGLLDLSDPGERNIENNQNCSSEERYFFLIKPKFNFVQVQMVKCAASGLQMKIGLWLSEIGGSVKCEEDNRDQIGGTVRKGKLNTGGF